jgi:MFS family permease
MRSGLPQERATRRLMSAGVLAGGSEETCRIALMVVVFDLTGSALWVSAALLGSLVLSMIASPAAGVVADRYDRRRVMIASAILQALAFAALAFASSGWQLVGLGALAAVAYSPFGPALLGAIPNLVGEQALARATAAVAGADQVATLVAPAVAGALMVTVGSRAVFLLLAACSLGAALAVARVPGRFQSGAHVRTGVRSEAREGLRLLAADRIIVATTIATVLIALFAGATLVAEVGLAKDVFHAGDAGYGVLVSAWGLGMVAGSWAVGRLRERRDSLTLFMAGVAAYALGIGLVAIAPAYGVALALLVLGGAGNGLLNTAEMLLYQERVPNEAIGRVRSVARAAIRAALVLSVVAGGLAAELLGFRGIFVLAGLGGAVALAAVLVAAASLQSRLTADATA